MTIGRLFGLEPINYNFKPIKQRKYYGKSVKQAVKMMEIEKILIGEKDIKGSILQNNTNYAGLNNGCFGIFLKKIISQHSAVFLILLKF